MLARRFGKAGGSVDVHQGLSSLPGVCCPREPSRLLRVYVCNSSSSCCKVQPKSAEQLHCHHALAAAGAAHAVPHQMHPRWPL